MNTIIMEYNCTIFAKYMWKQIKKKFYKKFFEYFTNFHYTENNFGINLLLATNPLIEVSISFIPDRNVEFEYGVLETLLFINKNASNDIDSYYINKNNIDFNLEKLFLELFIFYNLFTTNKLTFVNKNNPIRITECIGEAYQPAIKWFSKYKIENAECKNAQHVFSNNKNKNYELFTHY